MFELSSKMEFPEDQYYRLNRILLSTIGLWPYDNFKIRYFRFFLSLLIVISFTSPQLIKLFDSGNKYDLVIKILCYSIFGVLMFIKYVTFYAILKNVKEFRERVRNNWDALVDNQEIEIVRKHASLGKLFTICVAIFMFFMTLFYILTQYISILLDIVIPLNESRLREPLFVAEYFIDQQKYFHIIAIHMDIGLFCIIIITVATETFSLANAVHAFGLFKVASYRMEHVLSGLDPQMSITKQYILAHGRIIAAVDFHRRAIEFSELLKASFGPTYLILYAGGVILASINLYHLTQLITKLKEETLDIMKYAIFLIMVWIYITLANYAGQEFINSDSKFYRAICNTRWYDAPLKIQNLILLLILKTTKCYKVDAGGMFIPSLEGLATSMSMMVSYFMVLRST
ncbi:odorant receptor 63a-like [Linepithema humile]|uniref:odorant receptor 63a-like n=1 Tax=Linepithema humile TaxID=83485 RepID=UPI00351EFF90